MIAKIQQFSRKASAVAGLVNIDVRPFVIRIDPKANGLVVRDTDDDFEAFGVYKTAVFYRYKIEWLFVALPECKLDPLFGTRCK